MNSQSAHKILSENKNLWNSIASSFAKTRHYGWDIQSLAKYACAGMKVLDLGCGNGRLYGLLKDKNLDYTGIDSSQQFIKIARCAPLRGAQARFLVGDALNLPFGDDSFDLIYSLAVLHLMPSKELQLRFLKEARRVLKKDGQLVLTVWNLWQKKYIKLLIKFSLLKLVGKSKLDWGDLYIPWQKKYQRYHHAFRKNGLEKLFKQAGFNIKEIKYLKRGKKKANILIIATPLV